MQRGLYIFYQSRQRIQFFMISQWTCRLFRHYNHELIVLEGRKFTHGISQLVTEMSEILRKLMYVWNCWLLKMSGILRKLISVIKQYFLSDTKNNDCSTTNLTVFHITVNNLPVLIKEINWYKQIKTKIYLFLFRYEAWPIRV